MVVVGDNWKIKRSTQLKLNFAVVRFVIILNLYAVTSAYKLQCKCNAIWETMGDLIAYFPQCNLITMKIYRTLFNIYDI